MKHSVPNLGLFVFAVLVGASYWPGSHGIEPGALSIAWKGAGVGLLALWAATSAQTRTGRWIAGILACGAVGDIVLETNGAVPGAMCFLAGHIAAVGLYWTRRRRDARDGTGEAIGILLAVPALAYHFSSSPAVLVYAVGLGTMAAAAWVSRYPRAIVGGGAILFAVSDLLIFARIGPLAGSALPGLAIWPLYFAGQALIAYGVVTTERTWGNS